MKLVWLEILFVLLTSSSSVAQSPAIAVNQCEHSTELPQFWDSDSKPVFVPAPKGNLSLRVTGRRTGKYYPEDEFVPVYHVVRNRKRLLPAIHPYASPSALWSPSSELLAITSTEGGLVGTWNVIVYSIEARGIVAHNVMNDVRADFAHRFPAGVNTPGTHMFSDKERGAFAKDASWVNVSACGWLSQPERLIVRASVPPSSRFGPNMGEKAVYVVDPLSGKILQTYLGEQAKTFEVGDKLEGALKLLREEKTYCIQRVDAIRRLGPRDGGIPRTEAEMRDHEFVLKQLNDEWSRCNDRATAIITTLLPDERPRP